MPLFGAHMSIAGGCANALLAAQKYGCQTVQLFTKNSNQWAGKPLADQDVTRFRQLLKKLKIKYPTAHDSYLINLGSPDEALFRKSVEAAIDELQRAQRLGLSYLVMHPGAHVDSGAEAGLQRIAQGLDDIHDRCHGCRVQILLETTAGQGSALGHRFEHLAKIMSLVRESRRLGVCLDTCHVFAAGYALAPAKEYQATLRAFDKVIGLKRLKAFHLNDSQKPLGSRVDRHQHIGQGQLGLEPFRLLVNDRRFHQHPMLLETPKEQKDGQDMDAVNLATLRGLVRRGAGPSAP